MFGGLDFTTLDVAAITSSSDEEEEQESAGTPFYDPTRVDELLEYRDNLSCATQEDFVELFTWATRAGAMLDGIRCDRDEYRGRCLFAARACPEGGLLATLPRSLRIGQAFASQKLRLPLDTPDLSALTLLVLSFCQDEHVYARCLPRQSEFTNAMLMTPKERCHWEKRMGPEYAKAFQAMESRGQACQSYIQDYLSSSSSCMAGSAGPTVMSSNHRAGASSSTTLCWAISMVKSRSHAFGSKRGYWLTPVFDLVNHSTNPNARLEGDAKGHLVMKALRDIAQDKEITIDYMVDSDPQLLATYGFSLRAAEKRRTEKPTTRLDSLEG